MYNRLVHRLSFLTKLKIFLEFQKNKERKIVDWLNSYKDVEDSYKDIKNKGKDGKEIV